MSQQKQIPTASPQKDQTVGKGEIIACFFHSQVQPTWCLTAAIVKKCRKLIIFTYQGKVYNITKLQQRQYGKLKKQSEQEIVDFSNFNIEDLLLNEGIEFRNQEKAPGGWLPLEAYDDKEFDTRRPQDWIKPKNVSQFELSNSSIGVASQGLWKDKDGLCYWRRLRVVKYLPKSERYEGYWENTKEKCRLHRIFILFNEEDPRIFVRRFKQAYTNRVFADSLIKYNYFIENMPTHQIPEVDNDKINKVLSLTQNTKALRGKSSQDTTTLLSEINFDFAKTMNKIIFDKHLKERGNELITGNLKLPSKPQSKQTPYYGMISIPPHNFPEQFSQFCFNTLQNKDEVIKAQQDIRKECNDVLAKDIYNPNVTKTMRIDEFKQIQASSISQTSYYLRETWVNKIKEIIKNNFQESSSAAKSWFNLNETSKEAYDMGKLKKFLTQVKFNMQDTLLYMTQKSVKKFNDAIFKFLPIDVKVIDSNTCQNYFFTEEELLKKSELCKVPPPLFSIDLMMGEENLPIYSTSPNDIVVTIMMIFDNGLKALQEICQPEQKLLPHLFKTNMKMFLKATVRPELKPDEPDSDDKKQLPDENAWVYEAYTNLREKLEKTIQPLEKYIHTYDKYDKEFKLDPEAYIKKIDDEDNPPEIDFLKKDVIFHKAEAQRLKDEIPDSIITSIFKISCKEIRAQLAQKHEKIVEDEIELIAKFAKNKGNELLEVFDKMQMKIESQPKDIEELTSIREYMQQVPMELEKLQVDIKNSMNIYDILAQFNYKFHDDDDYDKKWRVFGSPQESLEKIEKQQSYLEKEKEKFLQQMIGNQTEFLAQITELENLVQSFSQYQDINQYEDVSNIARTIHQRLQKASEQAKIFNNREMLTGQADTDYSQIGIMIKEFQPYYNMWTTVDNWRKSHKSWLYDDFAMLNSQKMEETVDNSNKVMAQVLRLFRDKDQPGIIKIAESTKTEIDQFKPLVPLALALRNEGMKERHWEAISEKVGFEVKPYEGFTFNHCLEMELQKFTEDCVDIGEKAGKEYNIEMTLAKMKRDWENVEFNLISFKHTGTFSVTGFDDAMAMLDEHIVLSQTMQFSPFKKPFEEEIEQWSTTLLYVSECIDEWIKCQGQWMYLQPIFDSPDIMKQLPSENKKFKNVDKNWRDIINGTKTNPNVLRSCTREGLLQKFQDANKNLDLVQRGLKEYLEQKRSIFARFYFLSNDELLEILSQTKEVENVRPHLRKVFENMADLEFKPNKTIVAMYSGEKEKIEFVDTVDPREKGVEFWMGEVERMMVKSVRYSLKYSVDDYLQKARTDWILVHPGQCVLNGSQVHWTSEVEEAMKKEGSQGVAKYLQKLDQQLQDTVKLVRKKLTKLQSITLGALIVIDVHAKDVVDNLKVCNIEDTNAFEWISQLRYYWEDDDCRVKCIQTNFPYGYEYLGNTMRLVITPLTDKCYMTLMGALKLNLGGAPAGPAGTGKTESTKDLAKALAKQCVVFNCSDGMDYIMVGKFFKGLASAGAWCCFDEFNRINIEVLSVIAQQLLQLFGAKAKGEEELIFEESNIKLKPTFCVFITMNPGYAGRTELPDNLKALFRPVAMMVPDYALIGQIMLYSFGFTTAAILAKKMVTTFKLSSEQLSSQDHYDYGMRAVRSVINAAGLLKRQDPDMNEDQLLLRALRDVNVPKFLKDDLPLFENIISDLFPGVVRPNIDYGALLDQIKKSCTHFNLQPVQPFIDKIIQLYDTIQVRHGLMIVGPTGGGKTMNYKTLAHAMTQLQHMERFAIVHYHILNPKSITMGQLYGEFDPQTTEWIDGVLAKMVSDCARDENPDKHWIMFDGPVDALWIESMNTVLDDNKKLCLNSGQIIPLTDRMTMMFEVEDLAVASPATVSRCGMVYMEPGALGLEPLVKSWINTTPTAFKNKKSFLPNLENFFKKYLNEMIKFMRKNCTEPVPTVNNNITQSLMRILDCYFADYWDTELRKIQPEDVEELETILEPLFLFSLVWSIGCTTNLEGRELFNRKLRELMGFDNKFKFPQNGLVYDYCFDRANKDWKIWTDTVPVYSVDNKLSYGEIVVPTFDSIRMKYLKKLLITNKKHVLSPGPTGTGKTVNINELLTQDLSEDYQSIPITFSAQTSANQTQDALDEKFEKRRKGVYGPPPGKRFVIFVDDLNMPKKEEYGAQPPIEILRQWMDHQGWYDWKSKEKNYMKIEDIIFICAMGPPGGGRSPITKRLERHFNIITYTNLGKESIKMIFSQIVKAFLSSYSEAIAQCLDNIVESTQRVYNAVATNLKPTPSKSHYTFNLRDMSKIFQGLCSANAKTTTQVADLIRLWIHENKRVFGDRMISNQDRETLDGLLNEEVEKVFNLTQEQVYITERIIFGDYLNGIDSDNRPYIMIMDLKDMVKKIEGYLEDYNAGTKHPMRLIMFLDACDHVSRICRILRQPQGNALLLGVGGSGRQSLARLASYMSNYKCYQIEVVKGYNMMNWRDNLKTCLMQAGVDGKPTTFLFCDSQIINEQMLEDINNVLNSGDVPALYKNEDYEGIYNIGKTECMRRGITLNKMNMFSCYLSRVKQNIHVVLAMSPLGEIFRTRLRKFPSLVNCCTIDWFTEWPEEALLNVGKGSITDTDLTLGKDEDPCVEMFKIMHQSVEIKSQKFLDELRRRNYVTPTSYLELLNLYKSILTERRKYFGDAKNRLEKGLNVLYEAAIEVANLREMLEKKKPELQSTQIEVEKTKKIIEKDSQEAAETKKVVAVEEAEAATQEAEVSKIKSDADSDLAVALPALENAVKKVKEINVNDFYELKAVTSPSPTIVQCFMIVCFMTNAGKPKKSNDPKKLQYDPEGYFELAKQKLLNDPKKFLASLIDYDKDHIADQLVQKVKPLMEKEDMSEKKVANASGALVAVRIWVDAMIKYHETLKIVNPKRAIAAEMGQKLDVVRANLNEKRRKVKEIDEKLAFLQNQMDDLIRQEKQLSFEIEDCGKKLIRAEKMISGLEGEKVRWTETVKTLGEKQTLLVGDCLIAAGMVSYAGPFTAQYRLQLEEEWRENIQRLNIKHSSLVTMRNVLGDDVTIRQWSVAGLPNDNLSIENGIIMFKSRRWPLMIDPQTQANKFIKNMGKEIQTGLDVFKLSDSTLLRNLEMAIQFGKWVLVENIGEELDPALEPILLQQKIRTGSGYTIKIGEKTITYNESFKFFLTTTQPNPHYTPETSVKVTLLNFAITPKGLEEQMLNLLVQLEMPDLQEKKNQIVEDNAKAAKELRDIEDRILHGLTKNDNIAQILEDDELINILAESKKTSEQINIRMKESEITEKEIDSTRESFRPVAYRSSLLFFCIVDLALIDPMYQYSLQWFQILFSLAVQNSMPSNDPKERTLNLNNYFTLSLYQNVCRSLFEKHKLLFSFLLTTKILFGDNLIDPQEWRFFLAGPSGSIDIIQNPTDWLDDLEWAQVYKQLYVMATLDSFKGIDQYFIEFNKKFKKIFDSPEAHEEPMPGEWNDNLNSFQKMLILKAIRPDKISQAVQNFIIEKIGKEFIDPPTFNIRPCFKDSSAITPLIFVLSPGSDPVADFKKFAEEQEMLRSRTDMISLGQGQDKKAERMIDEAKGKGGWVLLQNCHLALSWMPKLEIIVENLHNNVHPDFRMWLTSMPNEKFPVSTLQNSVKMTLEPPQGLRANLKRSYDLLDNKILNDCNKPREFKKLLFGFAFFHANVQDRRKFGPIGWNIPYAFTYEDFDVCMKQLKLFLDEYEQIPYKVLNYLGAEINYGGRVTDDKDVRLIKTILRQYINENIMIDGHNFSQSGIYQSIKEGSQEDYITYISSLPFNPHPEAFGLHENAEITTNQSETRRILEDILCIQPRSSSSGGKTREQVIMDIAIDLESKTPPVFDLEMVIEKYPTEYTESMNTVLTQEVIRYNKLLKVMADMLFDVQKAVKGEIVMSEELEKMSTSLYDNQVPQIWADVGFLSQKPLASWTQDLNDRVNFLKKWIDGGTPSVFWISGFFFPQAFFTGTLQNYARKHVIAIDELDFEFKIYDDIKPQSVTEKPADGCYVYGMYLEGARWNDTTHMLDDSKPKQLYTELPLCWFLPKKNRKRPETGIYNCPVYKVLSRAGTLSTTGHSTNYVLMMELPSKEEEDKWICAGVAAFLALRY